MDVSRDRDLNLGFFYIENLVLRDRSELGGSAFENKKSLNPKHEIRNNIE